MKAVVQKKYGSPDVLKLRDVDSPVPGDNEVRIRIHATTVTSVDCTFRRGEPFISRLFNGLVKPKHTIPGTEYSGEIDAVGGKVKRFKIGDRVFGTSEIFATYAEYITLPEDGATLALMPENISFDEAAACDGYLTALPFLRDAGNIRRGQKVLIYGASGSVGSSAVQLAVDIGAEVTAVCSSANVDMVKSLGAASVIDYTKEDFTENGESYDIIFDTVGKTSFSRCKKSLVNGGVFLEATLSASILFHKLMTSKSGGKKAEIIFTGLRSGRERTDDLVFVRGLMESGTLRPVIDRRYTLEHIADAHEYVDRGHKKGNVVITVGPY